MSPLLSQNSNDELFCFSAAVYSKTHYQGVLIGWAPHSMPLNRWESGYFASAWYGDLTSFHQNDAVLAQPLPLLQGKLPQGGIVVCEYNRTKGTIGFGWPGRKIVLAYINLPYRPLLVPAFCVGYVGDRIDLID
jgi:hypothetical protein